MTMVSTDGTVWIEITEEVNIDTGTVLTWVLVKWAVYKMTIYSKDGTVLIEITEEVNIDDRHRHYMGIGPVGSLQNDNR